jgi:nitroreductase
VRLLDGLHTRRTVREFTSRTVPDDQLRELVRAAASAPSGGNRQPWAFIIVRDSDNLRRLRAAAPGISGVPTAFVVLCLDRSRLVREQGRPYDSALMSLGAAMENLLLAAHAQGLGACAVVSFHSPSVCTILSLPKRLQPMLLIALGYPVSQPKFPGRRALDEICFFERVEQQPP